MKQLLSILLVISVLSTSAQSVPKDLKPLNVGDKVPNIPFNILKMGKTKEGKDTSWTEVKYLYDFLDGTDDKPKDNKLTRLVDPPSQGPEWIRGKNVIGVAVPPDSVLIIVDCVPYEDSIHTIDPRTIRSITIYKGQKALDLFDYPSVVDIRTWDGGCDAQPFKFMPLVERSRKRWWQFWKRY